MVDAYFDGWERLDTRSGTVGLVPTWERIMMSSSFKSMIVALTIAADEVIAEPDAIEPGPSERLPKAFRWLPLKFAEPESGAKTLVWSENVPVDGSCTI